MINIPEDLKWLATNTKCKQFGQMSVRRNSDFHKGYQWSDLRQTGDGWYHHSKVTEARQQLEHGSSGISEPDEDECIQLAYERINSKDDKYSSYFKDVRHIDTLDVYRTIGLFECEKHGHPISHAAKKLLLSGARTGGKDVEEDVREAIDSLNRWLEMREEDRRAV